MPLPPLPACYLVGLLILPVVGSRTTAQTPPDTVVYRRIAAQTLRLELFRPPATPRPLKAILLFHGGGWVAGEPEWTHSQAREFARWGLLAIPVQYRLAGPTTTPKDAFDDVCAAFAWVRAHRDSLGLAPVLAGYGVSAGGHLVTAASTVGCPNGDPGPAILLLLSPALDVAADRWFISLLQGQLAPEALSPLQHVQASTAPTSIVQGAADVLTPLTAAQRYCRALEQYERACALHVYPGLGHLLTRNLRHQESDFDPDPAARADGVARHHTFLRTQGFLVAP